MVLVMPAGGTGPGKDFKNQDRRKTAQPTPLDTTTLPKEAAA
jgi:hypothetical protein